MSTAISLTQQQLENQIFSVSGKQVMLDFHLAALYAVETKRLNEQVKRNLNRFSVSFRFQLNEAEWESLQSQLATTAASQDLRSQNATAKRRTLPYVFTEQGIAMLSAVLNSDTAVRVSIQIIEAFVHMRQVLGANTLVLQRLATLERRQVETDQQFEKVFKALEGNTIPNQGVFYEGQVFDAYELASRIIRSAKKTIVLIDKYLDETTLTQLSKKAKGVQVLLLTQPLSKQLTLDLQKANAQYGGFVAKPFNQSHDRFLIIDGQEVYHLGASLKDLGKKWFAFSKLEAKSVDGMLNSILELL